MFRATSSPLLPIPIPNNYGQIGLPLAAAKSTSSLSDSVISSPSTLGSRMSLPQTNDSDSPSEWRDLGYPAYCEFIASSGDYFVLRRFNKLNTRVLLQLQDEIVTKETHLNNLDIKERQAAKAGADNGTFRKDPVEKRQELLRELRGLLKEYNEYFLSYSQLRDQRSARESQVENTRIWIKNHPDAIHQPELDYISTGHDLIPLVPQSKSWLRMSIEWLGPNFLSYVFPASHKPGLSRDPSLRFASNRGINTTITIAIVLFGLAVLLGPMWWLNYVGDPVERLKIITGFVVFFAGVLAAATVEKPFEVLIGTAGYAAVLMVYIQQQRLPGN